MDYKLYSKIFYIWLSQWCLFCKNSTGYHYWSSNEGELGRERVEVIKAITADGDFCHETKTLALWKKATKNLDHILKSRDITLPTKFHEVKPMVFPVVMYWCECWTIKKAECQRIVAFELCWRRLLRGVCKEIRPTLDLSQKAKEW